METKKLWDFPVPSGGCIRQMRFTHDANNVSMLFDYCDDDDRGHHGGILFKAVYGYKEASEKFYDYTLEGNYDTLVEYMDSEWLKTLEKENHDAFHTLKLRHFAIYLEDYGLNEIIAESFEILEAKDGLMPEPQALFLEVIPKQNLL